MIGFESASCRRCFWRGLVAGLIIGAFMGCAWREPTRLETRAALDALGDLLGP